MGRDAFAERYHQLAEWPLTVAAGLFLAAYAWPVLQPTMTAGTRHLCTVATATIWVMFAGDYLLRLALSRRRARYIGTHIVDLLVLVVPLLRPLRVLRVVTALTRLNRSAETSLRRHAMVYVVGGIALLGVVTAALAAWFVEHIARDERGEADLREEVAELAAEVRALRTELGRREAGG